MAEGAISKEKAKLSKKEYKKSMEEYKYPSVSYEIADQITKKTGMEVRVTVPGHTQRGGSPKEVLTPVVILHAGSSP